MSRDPRDVESWRRLEAEDPETAQLVRAMKATGFDITGVIYVKGKQQPQTTQTQQQQPFAR